jgi:hypothetical protein
MTSVAASVTGATGSASFAAGRPLRSPFTRLGACVDRDLPWP